MERKPEADVAMNDDQKPVLETQTVESLTEDDRNLLTEVLSEKGIDIIDFLAGEVNEGLDLIRYLNGINAKRDELVSRRPDLKAKAQEFAVQQKKERISLSIERYLARQIITAETRKRLRTI